MTLYVVCINYKECCCGETHLQDAEGGRERCSFTPSTYSTFPAGTENQTRNLQVKSLTLFPTKKHHTALCESNREIQPDFFTNLCFK